MSRAILPNILRDSKVLTPEMVNANFERLLEQARAEAGRRWSFDSFVIPFRRGASNSTDASHLQCRIRSPRPYRIIGRELYVYGTDGETFTVTTTGQDNIDVEAAGATTLAVDRDLRGGAVAADTDVDFVLSCAGSTWTANHAWIVVHFAYDRFEGSPWTAVDLDRVLSGDTMSAAKTKVNSAITDTDTMLTELAAAERRLRIQVIAWPDYDFTSTPALERDIPLPSDGQDYDAIQVCGVCLGGDDYGVGLYDEGSVLVAGADFTGSGATTFVAGTRVDLDDVATADLTSSGDYFLRATVSGGTVNTAYIILYMQ